MMEVKELKQIIAGLPDDCEVWIDMTHAILSAEIQQVMDVEIIYACTLWDGTGPYDPTYVSRIILSGRMRQYEGKEDNWVRRQMEHLERREEHRRE